MKQIQEKETQNDFLNLDSTITTAPPSALLSVPQDEHPLNLSTSFSQNQYPSFNEKISNLESENKKLLIELDSKSQENLKLVNRIQGLEEELTFIKTKTTKYLNELNEKHKKEIEAFTKTIRQLENQLAIATKNTPENLTPPSEIDNENEAPPQKKHVLNVNAKSTKQIQIQVYLFTSLKN